MKNTFKFIISLIFITHSLSLSAISVAQHELTISSFKKSKSSVDLRQILEFMVENDEVLLNGYDWNNREHLVRVTGDMARTKSKFKTQKKEAKESLKQFEAKMDELKVSDRAKYDAIVACKETMILLQKMQVDNPQIISIGRKLINENPHLDYWVKIKQMLGEEYQKFRSF